MSDYDIADVISVLIQVVSLGPEVAPGWPLWSARPAGDSRESRARTWVETVCSKVGRAFWWKPGVAAVYGKSFLEVNSRKNSIASYVSCLCGILYTV